MNKLGAYAKKTRRLHPEIIRAMKPFFKEYGWDLSKTRIQIVSPYWGKLSGRGSATAAFVIGNTVYIMRGALNKRGLVRGNSWDLATINGFSTFAHEVFHTYQNNRDGLIKFVTSLLYGIFKSIIRSRKLYDHKFFEYEREAIAFQNKLKKKVKLAEISQFKNMR